MYIIFVISAQKHRLWVLIRTASRVPTIYVLSRNMKNISIFYLKNCHFLVVKFSVYLNRHVFVMQWRPWLDCTDVQSDQGLHCLLTEPLHTTECMNEEELMPGWFFAHGQDNLNLCIVGMFKGTLSFDSATTVFNGPVNTVKVTLSQSVNLLTLFLGRLSSLGH